MADVCRNAVWEIGDLPHSHPVLTNVLARLACGEYTKHYKTSLYTQMYTYKLLDVGWIVGVEIEEEASNLADFRQKNRRFWRLFFLDGTRGGT